MSKTLKEITFAILGLLLGVSAAYMLNYVLFVLN
jgi:hypothetical protein